MGNNTIADPQSPRHCVRMRVSLAQVSDRVVCLPRQSYRLSQWRCDSQMSAGQQECSAENLRDRVDTPADAGGTIVTVILC
jgi:hypothetical protein